jgi:hypothetical protein
MATEVNALLHEEQGAIKWSRVQELHVRVTEVFQNKGYDGAKTDI